MKFVRNIVYILVLTLPLNLLAQPYELASMNGPNGGIVGDIAINSKDHLFVGVYSWLSGYYGLYRSTDNGDIWEYIALPDEDTGIYALYINRNDEIYVGMNGGGRIWKSSDDGETWESIKEGYEVAECWAFGESLDGIMFAGSAEEHSAYRSLNLGNSWEFSSNIAPTVFATDTNNYVYAGSLYWGLFGSHDLGLTWHQNDFLKNLPVTSILFDSLNNIYCGTGYYQAGTGLYLSPDNGENWINLGLDGTAILSLAIDSENNLYAGTKDNGVYKTKDKVSWTQHNVTPYNKQAFRMKINRNDDIFIGSEDEGVFRSTNGGESFEQIGLPISGMRNFIIAPNGNFYVATQSGVQEYNPKTKKWKNCGLNGVQAIDINKTTEELYVATFYDGLLRSVDYGDSWYSTSMNADSLQAIFNVKVLKDGSLLIATQSNLRYSNNNGSTWKIFDNISTSYFRHAIEIGNNGNVIVSCHNGSNSALFESMDNCLSFTEKVIFPQGLNYFDLNMIKINSKGDIFLCSYSNDNPVYRLRNGTSQLESVLDVTANSLFVDHNDWIYVGTYEEIYLSKDDGESWELIIDEQIKYNLPHFITEDELGFLYIGTSSKGLLRTTIPVSVESENKNPLARFSLEQNYPNPFNPSTTISYSIPKRDFVTLKVFDSLGKLVAVFVNEFKNKGTYSVIFDASEISSGVYFYKLQSGVFSETKKMLLLR